MTKTVAGLIAAIVLASTIAVAAQAPSTRAATATAPAAAADKTASKPVSSYTPPRTPWGDPDLQGVWPGTEMVGVPLQRPEQFGTRNVLTEQEFQARVAQAKQTEENALAEIDVFNVDTSNAGA